MSPYASLKGKKAFITGATSGIGEACARQLAAAGASVVLVARRAEAIAGVAGELRAKHGVQVETAELDVRDAEGLARLQRERPQLFEAVDVLVNNAGLARGVDPVQVANPDDWDEMIDTNVKGLLRMTRAILPGMVARGAGHVVNLGSTAGHWVYPGGTVYCATKHAVAAITEGIRMDVHGSGVRVSTVDPGLVETNFSVTRFRGDEARARQVYANMAPLTPDDVADAVLWCVTRPPHVNVQEVILMPTDQSAVTMVHRRPRE